MPALLTTMSARPKRSSTVRATRPQSASLVTSAVRARVESPIDAAASVGSSRSASTTLAPRSASSSATARPMPRPAPVTTATLSLWLCICLLLPNRQRVPLTRCSQPGSETWCWSPVTLSGRSSVTLARLSSLPPSHRRLRVPPTISSRRDRGVTQAWLRCARRRPPIVTRRQDEKPPPTPSITPHSLRPGPLPAVVPCGQQGRGMIGHKTTEVEGDYNGL